MKFKIRNEIDDFHDSHLRKAQQFEKFKGL